MVICGAGVSIYFENFYTIYCDPIDGVNNSEGINNDQNKGTVKDTEKGNSEDNSYKISGSIAKGVIKEAVQEALEGIGTAVPTVVGGMAGASLGNAIIKSAGKLPPAQKAVLGVVTAAVGGLGVTLATGFGRELVKNMTKDKGAESSASVSDVNVSKGRDADGFIHSVLEKGDELSPLQMILNYEIIFALLILVHMTLLILILFHKLYVSAGLNIFGKLLSKNIVEKYEKIKGMIEKIGTTYLIILFIINVIFILFYIFILIYANVELSNNLDAYINVHLKMNKSVIMLLLVKSNFTFCHLNCKNLTLSFNNSSFNYFIHSSAILKYEPKYPIPLNLEATDSINPRSPFLEALERLENERVSDLQLIKISRNSCRGRRNRMKSP